MPTYDLVVVGSGESGTGTALLAHSLGLSTFVSDYGQIGEVFQAELKQAGIPFEQGQHTEELILGAKMIVKSPGVPEKAPLIKSARAKGKTIIGEIEFAYRYMPRPAKIVAITGSNGKTTTTTLMAHLLKTAGADVRMGGNVGYSFARLVMQARTETGKTPTYVLELSSFQLDDIETFKADIAILLNITADHLDRYDYKLENYVRSKFRVGLNQKRNQVLFLNANDPETNAWLQTGNFQTQATIRTVSVAKDALPILRFGRKYQFDLSKTALRGPHNAFNAKAALAAALRLKFDPTALQKGLETYTPPPHRMELVAKKDGITWINDSKATNVDSVYYALQSVPAPIIWIAGGTDKGNDYSPVLDLVRDRVKALVCMGVDNSKLLQVFAPSANLAVRDTHTLLDALQAAAALAAPGDTVLLSPACASFDLFRNYEHRGDLFREEVKKLLK